METRRLEVLLELSRRGTMRAAAEHLGTSTSTVSQQVAALAREAGMTLIEPDGRRVRLTPAGRRLADHAVTILAAIEAARGDLDPKAEPAGTVRISSFATAIRRTLLPIVTELAASHPKVNIVVSEHEPAESLDLLATDDTDLALTYDYTLAPASFVSTLESVALWTTPWGLGVPVEAARGHHSDALAVFDAFRDYQWIGNSRNRADEQVIRTIASMVGFEPQMTHQADSLEIVEEMIVARMGIGLLPADRRTRTGVALLSITDPEVTWRAHAVHRRGRDAWPPLKLVLDQFRCERRHR